MSKIQAAVASAKKANQKRARNKTTDLAVNAPVAANNDSQDVGSHLSVESLRAVPVDSDVLKDNRILTHEMEERHPVQGAYRMLRTRVMQNMRTNGWRVLGVSSIRENEGKTFTSINLAISIAAEFGQEAVLVDLDLQKPSIYKYVGIDPDSVTGLKEYLTGNVQNLANLCINPCIDRIGMLLSTDPIPRSSDIIASERGARLFTEMQTLFSKDAIIVVDLPPLLAADDALAVAPMLDALLLVVAEGQTERKDLLEVQHTLESFNLIGTVLNKSVERDSKRTSYYY